MLRKTDAYARKVFHVWLGGRRSFRRMRDIVRSEMEHVGKIIKKLADVDTQMRQFDANRNSFDPIRFRILAKVA